MTQTFAPGWYRDPSGRHSTRWFDGQRYTDDVSDPDSQGQLVLSRDPLDAPAPPAQAALSPPPLVAARAAARGTLTVAGGAVHTVPSAGAPVSNGAYEDLFVEVGDDLPPPPARRRRLKNLGPKALIVVGVAAVAGAGLALTRDKGEKVWSGEMSVALETELSSIWLVYGEDLGCVAGEFHKALDGREVVAIRDGRSVDDVGDVDEAVDDLVTDRYAAQDAARDLIDELRRSDSSGALVSEKRFQINEGIAAHCDRSSFLGN